MTTVQSFTHQCFQCGSSLILSRGEFVCSTCGLVDGPKLEAPWNAPDHYEYGYKPHTINILGSYINPSLFDDLSSVQRNKFYRLKRLHLSAKANEFHRSLYALKRLKHAVEILHIPKTINHRACFLFKKIIFAINRGEIPRLGNYPHLVTVCLIIAVREAGAKSPIRLKEIIETMKSLGARPNGITLNKITCVVRDYFGIKFKTRKSEDYLQRVLNTLLSYESVLKRLKQLEMDPLEYHKILRNISWKIFKFLRSNGPLPGFDPYPFACSVVYAADRIHCRENSISHKSYGKSMFFQKDLAAACKVTEFTIRTHWYKFLRKQLLKMEVLDEQC